MPTPLTFSIPSQPYTVGLHPFGPFTIPAGYTNINLSLTRESWPDSAGVEIIEVLIRFSTDAGVTWSAPTGFGAAGGDYMRAPKGGGPAVLVTVSNFPNITVVSAPCLVQGTVNLQQPLSTSVSVVVT